ncbi:MAG TPA: methyltransferase domain-containing protein [Terriglobales bacterium]|jgi:ubiquinone/menaquinone biosynthesis C-methylase UbiE|nr:methyltransferase domain-containing protein [Terriglobales bacterium]
MKRVLIPELFDSDSGSPSEITAALADLRMANRWFGGAATMCELVREVARRTGRRELSLLDVGGASGDIPVRVARELGREGVRVGFVVLDRSVAHLNGTRRAVAGDALSLPFGNGSFDLVASSLFLHHLEPGELVRFINESLRVARVAALVNDLRRSPAHLALTYAGFALYRSRFTRHDAPASVRRAYTIDEMRDLLQASRAATLEMRNHYLCRMGAIAWR